MIDKENFTFVKAKLIFPILCVYLLCPHPSIYFILMSDGAFSGIYAKLELERGFETIGKAWKKANELCSWAITYSPTPHPFLEPRSAHPPPDPSASSAMGIAVESATGGETQAGWTVGLGL